MAFLVSILFLTNGKLNQNESSSMQLQFSGLKTLLFLKIRSVLVYEDNVYHPGK